MFWKRVVFSAGLVALSLVTATAYPSNQAYSIFMSQLMGTKIANAPWLFNNGLPYKEIKKALEWDNYICFMNGRIACIDKADYDKEADLFDLFSGGFVMWTGEVVKDASADDNVLYVATNKRMLKFTANNGSIQKNHLVSEGATAITKYNGGYAYSKKNGEIAGSDVPTSIAKLPVNNRKVATSLFSDGSSLIAVTGEQVYSWKPGVNSWEPFMSEPVSIVQKTVKFDEETHKLYFSDDQGVYECGVTADDGCKWVFPFTVTDISLGDGNLFVLTQSGSILSIPLDEDYAGYISIDAFNSNTDGVILASGDELFFAYDQGIWKFEDGGLAGNSSWNTIPHPVNLSLLGGRITSDWNDDLYMVAGGKLYRYSNDYSWVQLAPMTNGDKSVSPKFFAAVDNYAVVGQKDSVLVYDLADVLDGTANSPLNVIDGIGPVQAMTVVKEDDGVVAYLAASSNVYKCSVQKQGDCTPNFSAANININQLAYLPAIKGVLLCADEGLFKLDTKMDLITSQISDKPCSGVSVNGDKVFTMNAKGSVFQLDNLGAVEKSICLSVSPVVGSLHVDDDSIYLGSENLGVLKIFHSSLVAGGCRAE